MIDKKYKVKFLDLEPLEFTEGTTFKEISESFKDYFKFEILAVEVDNDIVDLSDTLKKNCNVNFFDRSSQLGNSIYSSSANFILILAIKNVLGKNAHVLIEHSMDHGVFCTISNAKINKNIVDKIYDEMVNIVKSDYIFTKLNVSRMDAIKYFKKINKLDKVNVLKYISNTYINLYRINDIYDYFYSRMAYSTSQINSFKLSYINDNGLVLSIPDIINPEYTLDYVHHEKVFNKFYDYTSWGKGLGICNAADLNRVVSEARVGELINLAEANYDNQLTKISEEIKNSKKDIKVILIAGPSSSGKTTTSKKLNTHLRSMGFVTHSIELDNYFIDIDKRELDSNGMVDFESINAIDYKLFNKNLLDLLNGNKVELPTYNFITRKREYNGNTLKLGKKDIIIVEGIHALNGILTNSISDENKYKIFISPLTQLNIDNHNHIHTSDVRKLRRIVRDSKTRGYTASETLNRWPSIKDGERKNIFRFQDDVDTVINSALIYEIGVLKTYVEPLLFNVSEDNSEYPEALRLINFLRNFLPIPSDEVPNDSVLREFIGGSCFKN